MTVRARIEHLLEGEDPLTNTEDRARLVVIAALIFAIIVIFLSFAMMPVHAAEDDGGSIYGRQAPARDVTTRMLAPAARNSDAPPGCPRTLFCGCALSLDIFGRIITRPNLKQAATWGRVFPRDVPAPGNVAVRSHHVFKLLWHVRGDVWMAFDPNSGGHRTRTHERSIAGHRIVNPHGTSLATLGVTP